MPKARSTKILHNRALLGGMTAVLIIVGLGAFYSSKSPFALGYVASSNKENIHLATQLHLPKLSWTKMMIEDSVRYDPASSEGGEDFAHLFPSGGHVVHMGVEQKTFTIAMFHQLRCLEVVRKEYAERGGSSMLAHHCLNYLRQSILCLADNRLEPVRLPGGQRIVSFSSDYICRDWSVLYDAAEKTKANVV